MGLSGLRGHLGGAEVGPGAVLLPAAEGLAVVGTRCDRQGRPVVILRLGGLTQSLVEACGKKALLR